MGKYITILLSGILVVTLSGTAFANSKSNTPNPMYTAQAKMDANGLTDMYAYTFANESTRDVPPGDCLLMSNGTFNNGKVVIKNNLLLVPIRVISESFGAIVNWDSSTQKVEVKDNDHDIIMEIGKNTAIVNGKSITLDVPPVIVDARTYVSLRFVSKYMDKQVGYLSTASQSNSKMVLANNPIVWIDDNTQIDENLINSAQISLKAQFEQGLAYMKANYSSDEHFNNIDAGTINSTFAEIENDIQKTQYIGQVGRYLVFEGPCLSLIDLDSNDIYFYQSGNAFCGIYKANMSDAEVFGGYFFG